MQVAAVREYDAVVDSPAHNVNLCTVARERSCYSPAWPRNGSAIPVGLHPWGLLTCCAYAMDAHTYRGTLTSHSSYQGAGFVFKAHKNSRLGERKTEQVFTKNHIVCRRA